MGKEESLRLFVQQVVEPNRQSALSAFDPYFHENKEKWSSDFILSFQQYCRTIRERQIRGEKGRIGHITFSMLRTEIADGRFTYLVEATDASWILDQNPCRTRYDADWALYDLDKLELQLVQESRQYMGNVTVVDLERQRLLDSIYFHHYVIELIRYAMPRAVQLPEFIELEKEEQFEVRVGEYMDTSEVVYQEASPNYHSEDVKEWLQEKNDYEYAYSAFAELDLSNGEYSKLDLRFSTFRDCTLSSSNFEEAVLVGTRWKECQLAGANFSYALLHNADLSGCDLSDATFRNSEGCSGFLHAKKDRPSFSGVNFSRANLTGANFAGASLRGAQFIDAQLERTRFVGADLTGAIFSEHQAGDVLLDESQRKGVIWRT